MSEGAVRPSGLFGGAKDMASRVCFAFVIFFFAGILILAVYLRSANHRVFYTLRRQTIEQPGRVRMNSNDGRIVWAVVWVAPETMPSAAPR